MKTITFSHMGLTFTRVYPFCDEGRTPDVVEAHIELTQGQEPVIELNISAHARFSIDRAERIAAAITEAVRIAKIGPREGG
jgi:hypothetical protein